MAVETALSQTNLPAIDSCIVLRTLANGRSRMQPDGSLVASLSRGNTTEFYRVSGGECRRFSVVPVTAVAVAFNNTASKAYILHSKTWKGLLLTAIDLKAGKITATTTVPGKANSVSVSAEDSILAIASGPVIKTYDPETLRHQKVFWEATKQQQVVFNPVTQGQLASVAPANTIQVRDLVNDKLVMEIRAHMAPIVWLQFDPTGKKLASYDSHGRLLVWNLETQQLLMELDEPQSVPSFSNNGRIYWDNGFRRREVDLNDNDSVTLKPGDGDVALLKKASFKRVQIYPQPIIAYTPETGFLAGAAANIMINPKKPRKDPRNYLPSSIAPTVTYGFGGKQLNTGLMAEIFTGDGWQFNAKINYNINERNFFFGVGENAHRSNREAYTNDAFSFYGTILKQITHPVKAGLQYNFRHNTPADFEDGISSDPVFRGGWLGGLGPAIQLDFRDDIVYPSKGSLLDANIIWYSSRTGSNYSYSDLMLNYRKYFPLRFGRSQKVLALQAMVEATWNGQPPFYQLPYLGSDRIMRGVFRNLYIYPQVAMAQAEYRSTIIPNDNRYGYVLFAGAGDGATDFFKNYQSDIKFVYGAGYRHQLLPKMRVDMRIDAAFTSKGDFGIFAGAGVAF
ncbi:MAG: BamA/TamA family outer membrane protein [Flavitalea sp.]